MTCSSSKWILSLSTWYKFRGSGQWIEHWAGESVLAKIVQMDSFWQEL